MPTYVLPQALVFQEFIGVPVAITEPLRALIAGPKFDLYRYGFEKTNIEVGEYDSTVETCYGWPQRKAGGVVDFDYTKIYFDGALLRYYDDPTGDSSVIAPVSGYKNRIRFANKVLAAGNGYDRSADFYDRDVVSGDVIHLSGVGCDSSLHTLETLIRNLIADVDPAVVDAATADGNNQIATVAGSSIMQSAGPINMIDGVEDGVAYDGLADGDPAETYTIQVTTGSIGGNATTARLKVTSASGNDNQVDVVPAAFGLPSAIGTRGLEVTFDTSGSSSSGSPVDQDDFVAGQMWVVTVSQDYTPATPASGGGYTGIADTTYIVTVQKGGEFADLPTVVITTTTGSDVSGPTVVTASGVAVAVGTKTVTIKFTGAALCGGDRFLIPVEAEADGAFRTVELSNNLPAELLGDCVGSSTAPTADINVELFIKKDIEVEEERTGYAPAVNWIQSETEICIQDGILAFDESWTDGGVLMDMEVMAGAIYVHYRALDTVDTLEVGTISALDEITDAIGEYLTPDNPLGYGVYKTIQNANGTDVKYIKLAATDLNGWKDAMDVLYGRDDVYGIVPLTRDQDVLAYTKSSVLAASAPETGRWRVAWFNQAVDTEVGLYVADSSGDPLLGTILDDPDTSGIQYTVVEVDGAQFLASEVASGDILRTQYQGDGFGNLVYSEYVVDDVISEETLRLLTGPDVEISTPSKLEIWHTNTKAEMATDVAEGSSTWGHRRIRNVWPDYIDDDAGQTVDGYFLCCALAGLRSGVTPHQGLTNVEIQGFSAVPRTLDFFTAPQLNTMAAGGTWIVTQDPRDLQIFTRHQLTTAYLYDDLNNSEDSVTANVDSISYAFLNRMKIYIGQGNVSDSMLDIIQSDALTLLEYFLNSTFVNRLGAQLIAASITEIKVHETQRDRIVVVLNLTVPYPLNNLEIHLVV